jgi:hypothetical protein
MDFDSRANRDQLEVIRSMGGQLLISVQAQSNREVNRVR